jgi:hypothetical protein
MNGLNTGRPLGKEIFTMEEHKLNQAKNRRKAPRNEQCQPGNGVQSTCDA